MSYLLKDNMKYNNIIWCLYWKVLTTEGQDEENIS